MLDAENERLTGERTGMFFKVKDIETSRDEQEGGSEGKQPLKFSPVRRDMLRKSKKGYLYRGVRVDESIEGYFKLQRIREVLFNVIEKMRILRYVGFTRDDVSNE